MTGLLVVLFISTTIIFLTLHIYVQRISALLSASNSVESVSLVSPFSFCGSRLRFAFYLSLASTPPSTSRRRLSTSLEQLDPFCISLSPPLPLSLPLSLPPSLPPSLPYLFSLPKLLWQPPQEREADSTIAPQPSNRRTSLGCACVSRQCLRLSLTLLLPWPRGLACVPIPRVPGVVTQGSRESGDSDAPWPGPGDFTSLAGGGLAHRGAAPGLRPFRTCNAACGLWLRPASQQLEGLDPPFQLLNDLGLSCNLKHGLASLALCVGVLCARSSSV